MTTTILASDSPRLTALLHCAGADLHQGQHPFWGVSISPEDLAGHISEALRELLAEVTPVSDGAGWEANMTTTSKPLSKTAAKAQAHREALQPVKA